jgi:hypothetical protein
MDKSEIILYQLQDGTTNLDVIVENETIYFRKNENKRYRTF